MVGLLPLFDPPRHDTKQTIDECIKKGISVKMVTGGGNVASPSVAPMIMRLFQGTSCVIRLC